MGLYRLIKTIIDPIIALLGIVILSPVFVIAAILIKFSSQGPVIFKQERLGHALKPFTLYKFRTMVKNAEKLKKKYKHLDFTDGPVFKIEDDPRFTKMGRYLARLNLDELPQLFNILIGNMYFVGYRPPTPDEVKQYKKWQLERFKGYPGLTSLWAVSGMHSIKFNDWIKMDIDYAKNESLLLDLKVIGKTLFGFVERIGKLFGKEKD